MTKIMTKATAKVAAVATGLALASSILSVAPMAHAAGLSTSQVQSILSLLSSFGADSATIANVNAALTGGAMTSGGTSTGASCSVGTADLKMGSSGASVMALQQALIAGGYSIPAGVTGYFGAQTQAAVMAWQKAAGVMPASGYFGAISRAHWNLSCGTTGGTTTGGTTTGGTTTGTTLTGSGRLSNVSSYGDVDSDLKEGDSATSVVGVSADAIGGDVAIQRVDVIMTISSNISGSSSNLNKYVSDVSLYLDGKKIGSMDPALGDKDGRVWTLRFSGLNGVIMKGMTGNLSVKVTPVSSIGSSENGETITAKLDTDSVRAVGADGISDTYVSTPITEAFTVSSATDGTLTASEAGDNPVASQVAVSSSTTTGVKLLSFNLKAKNQDVDVTDLAVSFGTSDNNLNDVVSNVKLMRGSTVLSTKTLSTGTYGVVTFSNVNQTIPKDATWNFTVVADIKGDASYADGTTLIASSTTSGWDVSDANGSSVTPSAAVVGHTMTLTATGLSVTRGTPTTSVAAGLTGAGDIATLAIPFTVTAGDNDIFVSGVTGKSGATTKVVYATTTTSTSGATGEGVANLSVGNTVTGDSAGAYYKVLAGTSRTFTLTVAYTATTTGATTAGYVGLQLSSIAYGTTNSLGSTYSSNLDSFKTSDVYVTKR